MDDLDAFVALETSLRARESPPRQAPNTADSARYLADFVRVWERGELGYWTILFQDQIAGFGGVRPKIWRDSECWNLYYRVTPELWGLGIATETACEAISAARSEHPDWPILVETHPDNLAAIKVAERAGLHRREPHPGDEYAVLSSESQS
jgi:RimJ/RimL family protein N-acetyltransferase